MGSWVTNYPDFDPKRRVEGLPTKNLELRLKFWTILGQYLRKLNSFYPVVKD